MSNNKKTKNNQDFPSNDDSLVEKENQELPLVESNHLGSLPFKNFNVMIQNLLNPKFLGSYHIKQRNVNQFQSLDSLLAMGKKLKHGPSFKHVIFNPLTITFIILLVIVNVLWLISILF
ncbi:MAG: hypothetical protein ACTSRH_00800 [Promethearchaeota archaeon]